MIDARPGRLRRVVALLGVHYDEMLEYRAELVLWMLSGSLPLILMGVWMQTAASRPMALQPIDFARYFIVLWLVRQATAVWVIYNFEAAVVEGRLSQRLLQPIDPGWHDFTEHVAERLARLPFLVALVGLFALLYPEAVWLPRPAALATGLALTAGAFMTRFAVQYTLAMVAFWSERASALQQLWFLFYIFLSGLMAPLTLFPPSVRTFAELTPFPYLVYMPTAAFLDSPAFPVDVGRAALVLTGWFVCFAVLNRWLWRRGLRRYSGMGA